MTAKGKTAHFAMIFATGTQWE